MIKFEDLKVGDKIKEVFDNKQFEVVATFKNAIVLFDPIGELCERYRIEYNCCWLSSCWSYYTPPKKTKQEIRSPAYKRRFADCNLIFVSSELFLNEEEAKECLGLSFHSWPAKDGQGRPIQYLVEVEE